MIDADLSDLLQQRLGLLRVLVDPRLALHKQLRAAALDHVAQQRPRRAAEAKQRHATLQLAAGEGDGLVDIAQLVGHVDGAVHDLLVLLVIGALEGFREVRALLVDHLDDHTHGLGDDEDVGEDDGGVDEAGKALDGLQGQRRGDLWVAAALEEVAVALGLVVLREVSAGWVTSTARPMVSLSSFTSRRGVARFIYVPWRITQMGGRSTFSPAPSKAVVSPSISVNARGHWRAKGFPTYPVLS